MTSETSQSPSRCESDLGLGDSESARAIHLLIEAGKCKQGVELAKSDHKRMQTPASEQVLVGAYIARIEQFLNKGSAEDARTLIILVGERFPKYRNKLSVLELRAAAAAGGIDRVVKPLLQADILPETREAIETVIRQEVVDLPALAKCAALPADHGLRTSAAAVWGALVAVSSGAVTEEQIALPEVSRRSPLASWKMLVRAIAAFHRNDDEGCRRAMQGIAPDAAAARLVLVLTSMIEKAPIDTGRVMAIELQRRVRSDPNRLRQTLAKLEEAIGRHDFGRVLRLIGQAMSECLSDMPDRLPKLRQHVSVRCRVLGMPLDPVLNVIGSVRHDAYFWRLGARGFLSEGMAWMAALFLERFLRHAIQERLITARSVEAAAVYHRMARVATELSAPEISQLRRDVAMFEKQIGRMYKGQPPEIAGLAPKNSAQILALVTDADVLYRQAVELDPEQKTFVEWMNWARASERPVRQVEDLVKLWREKLPNDPMAPLVLSTIAEERNALHMALKYLSEAERIDAMNPAVRKARLRLTLATAWRHLKARKAHLLDEDIAQLRVMPTMGEGDRGIFLDALQATSIGLSGDLGAMQAAVVRLMERAGPVTAMILLASIECESGVAKPADLPAVAPVAQPSRDEIVEADIRATTLGIDLDFGITRPLAWDAMIVSALKERPCPLTALKLVTIARGALRRDNPRLAYEATVAGLQSAAGITAARFLLLRAQSLENISDARIHQCLAAAMELARQSGDATLISEIVKEMNQYEDRDDSVEDVGEETLNRVMDKERQATEFPKSPYDAERHVILVESQSRRPRAEDGGLFDDWDAGPNRGYEPEEEEDGELPDGLTAQMLFDELGKIMGRKPTPRDIANLSPDKVARLISVLMGKGINLGELMNEMAEMRGDRDGPSRRRGKGRR